MVVAGAEDRDLLGRLARALTRDEEAREGLIDDFQLGILLGKREFESGRLVITIVKLDDRWVVIARPVDQQEPATLLRVAEVVRDTRNGGMLDTKPPRWQGQVIVEVRNRLDAWVQLPAAVDYELIDGAGLTLERWGCSGRACPPMNIGLAVFPRNVGPGGKWYLVEPLGSVAGTPAEVAVSRIVTTPLLRKPVQPAASITDLRLFRHATLDSLIVGGTFAGPTGGVVAIGLDRNDRPAGVAIGTARAGEDLALEVLEPRVRARDFAKTRVYLTTGPVAVRDSGD